jgi:syntaxin-binding protein 1
MKNPTSPVDESAGAIKLLILDRSYDPITPLAHDFYYQSLIGDLIDMGYDEPFEFTVTSSSGEKTLNKHYLDENDSVWTNFRYKHMADTLDGINLEFKEMTKHSKAAKIQKGEHIDLDINQMQEMISKIPEYTLMLSKYTMHTELLNRIMGKFNEKNLKDVGELEMLLTTGVTDDGDKPDSKKIYNMVLSTLKSS